MFDELITETLEEPRSGMADLVAKLNAMMPPPGA